MSEIREIDRIGEETLAEVMSVNAFIAGVIGWGDLKDSEEHEERDLWRRLADVAGEEPENYQPSLIDYVNLDVLELRVLGHRLLGDDEWETTGVSLLLTYGGPNVYLVWDGNESVSIEVYDGSEKTIARRHASGLAAAFADLVS
jgi:hypothetical protein